MPLSINCSAEGQPAPAVMWYKDQILIQSGMRVSIMYGSSSFVNESSLKITSLTFDDIGVYECVAMDTVSLDNITQTFVLDVVGGMNA